MSTINRLILSGRLVRDPEVREIRDGLTVAKITIVVSTMIRQKDGEEREEACFIDCSLWNQEARDAQRYLTKGKAITIEGRLKLEKWTDKNSGMERSKHVLVAENVTYLEKVVQLPDEVSQTTL